VRTPSEYPVEDLFDHHFSGLIDVRGFLCMVYQCYVDDSKDQNQDKVFVSAGFVGQRENWTSLQSEWKKCLLGHGIAYFKTSEYKMLTGEFAKFRVYPKPHGRNRAKVVKDDLQQIIATPRSIIGVAIAVKVEDYKKVISRPEAIGIFDVNPYHRALESLMIEIPKRLKKYVTGHNMVAFTHDDGDDATRLLELYKDFRRKNPRTAKMLGGLSFLDDKIHAPLQMADMQANNILGSTLELLDSGGSLLNPDTLEMAGNLGLCAIWDEAYMLSVLKSNLVRSGKKVPLDLADVPY
jgi:hypothetical protein